MSTIIINFDDLSESRILQERKPPLLINIFVYFLLIMFTAAMLYAWFGRIEIVVKTHGIIRPFQTISRIRSFANGRIEKVLYYPGQYVEKGDVLVELDKRNASKELNRTLTRINELHEKLSGILSLKESLESGLNLISTENQEFSHRYSLYLLQKKKLELSLESVESKLNTQKNMSQFVAKSEIEELENQFNMASLELHSFDTDYFVSVIGEISNTYQEQSLLISKAERLEEEIELTFIKAPISGIVNSLYELNSGDYMFVGTEIMNIIPENRGMEKVEIILSNKDILGIEPGDTVSYRLPNLPTENYSVLKGEVLTIPADMKSSHDGHFLVEGSIDASSLLNDKENPIEIKPGMYVDARITIHKRKIIFHLLDKLGLLPNIFSQS